MKTIFVKTNLCSCSSCSSTPLVAVSEICESFNLMRLLDLKNTKAALQRCSYKTVFWKYLANLQEPPIPKCDFNKVAKQLYWNYALAWVFSCQFAAYLQSNFIEIALRHWCSPLNLLQFSEHFSPRAPLEGLVLHK